MCACSRWSRETIGTEPEISLRGAPAALAMDGRTLGGLALRDGARIGDQQAPRANVRLEVDAGVRVLQAAAPELRRPFRSRVAAELTLGAVRAVDGRRFLVSVVDPVAVLAVLRLQPAALTLCLGAAAVVSTVSAGAAIGRAVAAG